MFIFENGCKVTYFLSENSLCYLEKLIQLIIINTFLSL